MKTFIKSRKFIQDNDFNKKRNDHITKLDVKLIDKEIRTLIEKFKFLDYCFTIQSCYGHIVEGEIPEYTIKNINLEFDLPEKSKYQIAYLTICIKNNYKGHSLYNLLKQITKKDSSLIHFGSANWFWINQNIPNSYIIQTVPKESAKLDHFHMPKQTAKKWLKARNIMFKEIETILQNLIYFT